MLGGPSVQSSMCWGVSLQKCVNNLGVVQFYRIFPKVKNMTIRLRKENLVV